MKIMIKLFLLFAACLSLAGATPTKFADKTVRQLFNANKKLFIGAIVAVPTTILTYKVYQSWTVGARMGRAIVSAQNDAWNREVELYKAKLQYHKPWKNDWRK